MSSAQRRPPTRNDVARLAGTSPAVVSYVVNNGPRPVAAETRARVLHAIEQLQYRPNGIARSLRGNRSHAIGLIVPDNANPFFAELARVIEDHAFERDFTVLLGNTAGDDARELEYARAFLERRVDGIILISTGHSGEAIRELTESRVPMAVVDRHVPVLSASVLVVDNEAGGYLATSHLLEHGHERIACIAGPSDITLSADRHHGWSRALREAGREASADLLLRSTFDRVGGFEAATALLSGPAPPTAIFAATDQQGIGAIRAAADLGLVVGSDVAIVSFDGIAESAYTVPGLTTVAQPFDDLGRRAVELLLDRVAGAPSPQDPEVLPVRLVLRQSCGCPRG